MCSDQSGGVRNATQYVSTRGGDAARAREHSERDSRLCGEQGNRSHARAGSNTPLAKTVEAVGERSLAGGDALADARTANAMKLSRMFAASPMPQTRRLGNFRRTRRPRSPGQREAGPRRGAPGGKGGLPESSTAIHGCASRFEWRSEGSIFKSSNRPR